MGLLIWLTPILSVGFSCGNGYRYCSAFQTDGHRFQYGQLEAVLPKLIEEMERFGCKDKIVSFVLPQVILLISMAV
jgi:hypothetical protein